MFSIDTLYTLGLRSIAKDSGSSDEDTVELDDSAGKNRAFTVQVGLGFPIGK